MNIYDSSHQSAASWDPECDVREPLSEACRLRIKNDLVGLCSDPAPGICVIPDPDDMGKIYALITGPFDTPYEGGFFLFCIVCTDEYPLKPPKVKLMTTGNHSVRFNPNLYSNGMVCLSILGTWTGPEWTPAQSISSVLISIQSLLCDNPYYNEPGFSEERRPGDSKIYNEIIMHETIRCAVCDILDRRSWCPDDLFPVIESSFEDYYDYYVGICTARLEQTGQRMTDPFGDQRGYFQYATLLTRLHKLKTALEEKYFSKADGTECGEPSKATSSSVSRGVA